MNSTSDSRRAHQRRYLYLGDRLTDDALRGAACTAVLREDGKCICGASKMLVRFARESSPRVVLRQQLRKVATGSASGPETRADSRRAHEGDA